MKVRCFNLKDLESVSTILLLNLVLLCDGKEACISYGTISDRKN